jgi:fimbrial chaperone protein
MVSFAVLRRALAAAAAILVIAPAAFAAISVTPVLVGLGPKKQSELITVSNDGDTVLRLQVELFAWQQRTDGETVLSPTQDVLAFPPLLTLAPHETKRIRIGAVAAPGAAEKSYRLSVQELPSDVTPAPTGVRMLTKISIPIFLQPGPVKPEARIEAGPTNDGALVVRIKNAGTGHFILTELDAVGRDAGGRAVFDSKAPGWYVLAGGERDFRLTLSAADCRAARRIELNAKIEDQHVTANIPVAPEACGQSPRTQLGNAAP